MLLHTENYTMNEKDIESALKALGEQVPKPAEMTVENMVRTVDLLGKERARRTEKTAEPLKKENTRELSKPEKKKGRIL